MSTHNICFSEELRNIFCGYQPPTTPTTTILLSVATTLVLDTDQSQYYCGQKYNRNLFGYIYADK